LADPGQTPGRREAGAGQPMTSEVNDSENPDRSSAPRSRACWTCSFDLITGAADDDPSGIATYSQAGAQFGFGIIWTILFSYRLMAAIQEISARIGRTTGHGIATNLREHYPSWLLPSNAMPRSATKTIASVG